MTCRWLCILALLAASPNLVCQCNTPSKADRGVLLYEKPEPSRSSSSFWSEFSTMFDFLRPQQPLPFQRSIAFLVGVSKYSNPPLKSLPGVENDLDRVCQYLLSKGGFDRIYVARGTAATPETVNYYMMDFFHDSQNIGPNDRLLFYYSGHGGDDGSRDAYLLFGSASPGMFGDNQVLAVDSWEKWSKRTPAKHALYIFDACVAGEVFEPKSGGETERDRVAGLLATLSGSGSRTVVTAGTSGQATWYAKEKSLGYSVFTNSLLAVLQDQHGEPLISIDEAVEQAAKRTAAFTDDKKVSPAIPDVRRFEPRERNGRFVFLNSNASSRALPEELRGAILNKGGNESEIGRQSYQALELTTSLVRTQDDPALSLYIAAIALGISKESTPPANLIYYIEKSLYRGASYGRIQTGSFTSSMAWSPDGKTLASVGYDHTIHLWESDTGRLIQTLEGQGVPTSDILWSPDGHVLASSGNQSAIQLWDSATGKVISRLGNGDPAAVSLTWGQDGKTIVSLGDNMFDRRKEIRFWNIESGAVIRTLTVLGDSARAAWSPDGKKIALLDRDNSIGVWNLESGEMIHRLEGHSGQILSLAWSQDRSTLASSSLDGTLRIWDTNTGQTTFKLAGHSSFVICLAWSPDGKTLASGSYDRTVRLWEPSVGRSLRVLEGHSDNVRSLAWSSDGKRLASGSEDRSIRLWQPMTGQNEEIMEHSQPVSNVAWSSDGETIGSAGQDATIRLWDRKTGALVRVLTDDAPFSWLSWTPDDRMMVSSSEDMAIKLWDPLTGKNIRVLGSDSGWVYTAALSPNGKVIASVNENTQIRLRDVVTGRILQNFAGPPEAIVTSLAWSPDGKKLAAGSGDRKIRLWNPETGTAIRTLEGHTGWVRSVTWSPDGKTLASGGDDSKVLLWAVASGEVKEVLETHSKSVASVAWGRDENTLAVACDGNIRIWDIQKREITRRFDDLSHSVTRLEWSPDGAILASDGFKVVQLWPVSIDELLRYVQHSIRLFKPTTEECISHFNSETCPTAF